MNPMLLLLVFGAVVAVVLFISTMAARDENVNEDRMGQLMGSGGEDSAAAENQKWGGAVKELARNLGTKTLGDQQDKATKEEISKLQARLIHAGIYSPGSVEVYVAARMLGIMLPCALGAVLYLILPSWGGTILMGAAVMGLAGFIGPSMWLDRRKTDRQLQLRRGIPDAMDIIVICMEGGLALPASVNRVANELKMAHPMLSNELMICQKEIQLGKTTGTALRDMSIRTDMEEIRTLAGVIAQAEKFGASLAQALKSFAEDLRIKRMQIAEEKAAQASTKIMFPTLLFIFPAIFLVILGPAAIMIQREMFNK